MRHIQGVDSTSPPGAARVSRRSALRVAIGKAMFSTTTNPLRSRPRTLLVHAFTWLLLCAIAAAATDLGLRARERLWRETMPIRYTGDIDNGWNQGNATLELGVVKRFDELYASQLGKDVADYGLDYPPMRLWMMTQWTRWTKATFNAKGWQPSWEFNAPVLWANTIAHGLSAILTFALIGLWVRRTSARVDDRFRWKATFAGVVPATVGALLFWFSPAVVWNGHAFPQWDLWMMPFFLGAVLAASLNGWFIAGALVIVGAMFKGQMLLGAPLILLWPIFAGRWGGALRVVMGAAFATAACAAPWLIRSPEAVAFLRDLVAAGAIVAPGLIYKRMKWLWPVLLLAACVVVGRHLFVFASGRLSTLYPLKIIASTLSVFAASVMLLRYAPVRRLPHVFAGALAVGALLCIPLFKASPAWFFVGFEYGSRKYPVMGTLSASNLPTLLERRFGGWQPSGPSGTILLPWPDGVVPKWLHLPAWAQLPPSIEMKTLLIFLFVIALIASAIACAIQDRRRDARVLAGVCSVWVWMFMLLPQMHNRYLIWGAATAPLLCAIGVGPALAGICISLACWSMMAVNQFEARRELYPMWLNVMQKMHVDMAWALLLLAGVITCVAFGFGRRKREITHVVTPSEDSHPVQLDEPVEAKKVRPLRPYAPDDPHRTRPLAETAIPLTEPFAV